MGREGGGGATIQWIAHLWRPTTSSQIGVKNLPWKCANDQALTFHDISCLFFIVVLTAIFLICMASAENVLLVWPTTHGQKTWPTEVHNSNVYSCISKASSSSPICFSICVYKYISNLSTTAGLVQLDLSKSRSKSLDSDYMSGSVVQLRNV